MTEETPFEHFAKQYAKELAEIAKSDPYRQIAENVASFQINRPEWLKVLQPGMMPGLFQPEWLKAMRSLAPSFEEFVRPKWLEPIRGLAEKGEAARALDQAGWLPHVSVPNEIVVINKKDIPALKGALDEYFENHWREVRAGIEQRLENYLVDDEGKLAFREALETHERGLYRSTCRHLFGELERVTRVAFDQDTTGSLASQKELIERAGDLYIGEVDIMLFSRLVYHLYAQVKDDAAVERFAQDPVPNRHACLHGVIVYKSMQNSLNTIFLAESVFQIVTTLKLKAMQAEDNDKER